MSLPPLPSCSNRGVGLTTFEPGFARKEQWGSELTRGQWEKPHWSTSLPGQVNPLGPFVNFDEKGRSSKPSTTKIESESGWPVSRTHSFTWNHQKWRRATPANAGVFLLATFSRPLSRCDPCSSEPPVWETPAFTPGEEQTVPCLGQGWGRFRFLPLRKNSSVWCAAWALSE